MHYDYFQLIYLAWGASKIYFILLDLIVLLNVIYNVLINIKSGTWYTKGSSAVLT